MLAGGWALALVETIVGAVEVILSVGNKVRIPINSCWSWPLSGDSRFMLSFCSCKRANGVVRIKVRTSGKVSILILVKLMATPGWTLTWQIAACSPKLVFNAFFNTVSKPISPTVAEQEYKLPPESTLTSNCAGANGWAGGAISGVASLTGALTTVSTGTSSLSDLKTKSHNNNIALIAAASNSRRVIKSLRWLRARISARLALEWLSGSR